MEHLSSLRFIHRDLAARNVLVADGKLGGGLKNMRTGASLVCKVADFGLSRGGDGGIKASDGGGMENKESYYKSSNGVFPIRWTAPESMESLRYTEASDVWSFGVFLVELLQDGTNPYHGQSNPDVMKMVLSGGRHPKPSNDCCTDELYTFMLQCWHQDVAQRPTFAKVVEYIKPAAVTAAEDEGKPEVEPRKDAYKKFNGFNNQYNDMGFDNDGTQSPRGGSNASAAGGVAGGTATQAGDLSAADEAVGYMVTADGAALAAGVVVEEETGFGFGFGDDE